LSFVSDAPLMPFWSFTALRDNPDAQKQFFVALLVLVCCQYVKDHFSMENGKWKVQDEIHF